MPGYAFNISKGRFVEFFNRVKTNDPANSAIVLVPCSASDTEANAQDADTLTAALATAINEQTGSTWARVVLTDAELAAIAVDDTNNRFPATIPEVSFGSPAAANDTTGLLVCYDPDTTGGTDANIIPIVHLDFVVETDGNEVTINPGDISRAA